MTFNIKEKVEKGPTFLMDLPAGQLLRTNSRVYMVTNEMDGGDIKLVDVYTGELSVYVCHFQEFDLLEQIEPLKLRVL